MPHRDRERIIKYQRKRRRKASAFVAAFKQNARCAFCGWNVHPEILQLHHIDPTTKRKNKRRAYHLAASLSRLKAEFAKCILLCPNCHMWHHYADLKNGVYETRKQKTPEKSLNTSLANY